MSDDSKPFLIQHPDGRVYELANDTAGLDTFLDDYKPQGFAVVDPAPTNYATPDFSERRAARKAAAERERAEAEAAKATEPAKADDGAVAEKKTP